MPEMTFAQALGAALREEMQRDPDVVLMGEDVGVHGGVFTVSKGLLDEFGPGRVRDTPISEAGFIGLAAGAAMTGMRPVVEIMYMDFMLVGADSVVNQAAKMRYMTGGQVQVPIVIRTQQGGGRGNAAQHSQSLDAMWAHVPGLKVVMPVTPYDAKGLLKSAIRDNNPVMFIEHKLLYFTKGDVPDGEYALPLGKAEVKRKGADVTIVGVSRSVLHASEAAEKLAAEGISAEVIDVRSVRPLDIETILNSVRKTHRLVLVHEAVQFGSVISEIAATVQEQGFDYLDAPISRVGGADSPVAYSLPLEQAQLPDADKIVAAVRKVL
jgi:pyruvate/2-oxoglutarate/acetoin dehydrogenase E1 component